MIGFINKILGLRVQNLSGRFVDIDVALAQGIAD